MNKIKLEREHYMKHAIIDLNDPHEPIMFSRSIFFKFFFETFFDELEVELYPLVYSYKKYKLLKSNYIADLDYTLVEHSNDASIG